MKESTDVAGLVLIAGPVSPGKSTLLSAAQKMLPADQFDLEISDQVEVPLPKFMRQALDLRAKTRSKKR